MKKIAMALAAASMTVTGTMALTAVPAEAHKRGKHHDHRRYYTSDNGIRYWQGDDGRYRCQRSNGTTGLLVGAGVGALLGNEIAGRGDKTLGAIVGGLGGAAAGRAIDRSRVSCR